MENSTKINMPTINADDIIEKAAIGRVKELDTLVNNMADSLSKAANGKNLSKYWKTQDELIKDVIASYKTYNKVSNKDNATELIKVTNALKAIAGVDLSNILPNFDEFTKSLNSAEKKVGSLDSAFDVKGFKEVFDVFKALEQQGLNVQKIFSHFGVSSDVGELQQVVRSLKNEVADLTRKLLDADNANEELKNEFDDFKAGSGIAKKLDELDELKKEMQNIRDEATQTFNQFLDANKIDRYDWFGEDRFSEYFERLEDGTLTATEAIIRFKSEYAHLLEDSYRSSGNSFGLDQLQAFSTKLDSIFHQVEETAKKINDIISNGVIAKSVQNLSEDTTLSDSQRSIFGNILQDEEALKSIKSLFQKIVEESNNAKNTEIFNTEQFAKVETIFEHIESTLSSIKSVLVDVGEGEELSPLLKMLDDIRKAASNIKLGLNIDLGSEISEKLDQNVSQATQRQVTAYQKLLKEMFKAKSNKEMFDFYRNGIPENASNSELVGIYKGIIKRAEDAGKIGNTNIYKKKLGSVYDELKREIKNANAQLSRAETKRSENGILGDLFGNNTDLSGVIEQLNIIVSKLDEISESAKGFTEAFKDGLNVNASVEEIEKLTNRVKELEDELAKVKTPTVATAPQESNISSGMKDAFPSTEATASVEKTTQAIKEENNALEETANKAKQAVSELVKGRDIVSQNWYREKGTVIGKDSNGNDITRDADEFSFVERLKNGQLQTVLATYNEETGKWAEQIIDVRTAFEQVEKAIISADNKIASLEMAKEKTLAAHPGYDATADDNQIAIERKKRDELQNTLNLYGQEKEYVFDIEAANKRIADNQERLNNKKQSQTNLRQTVSEEQFSKDWDAAIAENNKREATRQKSIEQTNRLLNKQQIIIDGIEKAYSKAANPDLDKGVDSQSDLIELANKKAEIQTLLNKLSGQDRNSSNEKEFLQVEKLVAEYKQLAKDKLKANNPSKQELGGQKLDVLLANQVMQYNKLISQSEKYGDATKEITDELKAQRDLIAEQDKNGIYVARSKKADGSEITANDYYKARDNYKINKSILGSYKDNLKLDSEKNKQQAKAIKAEWDKNIKAIQDYMDVVTKLNNLKTKDKGTGSEANQIELQTKNVEKLKQAAWDARQNLSSIQAENPDIIAWKQWVDMMELFDQASKGSAESAAKLKDVLENIKPPSLDKYENKLFSFQTKTSGYDATIARFENGGWTSPEYLKNIQAVKDAVQKYEILLNKIKTEQNSIASETDIQTLKEYESEIKKTIATVTNMSAAQKGYSLVSGQKELDKIRQILKENSAMSAEAKGKIKAYYREIESGNPSMSLDKIHGEIMKIVNAEAEAGRAGKRMWDVIKEKAWYGAANVIGTYFGVNDIFRYIQQGISTVREFDTALTEMRKVSDESVQSLKNYQSTTFDTANAVGTTAKQIQESTADYMRLGESLDEASESAKTANILLNVSEFDNIEDATKSLVAMGQAYKDLDKMTIVDKLNEVGNNYAISTDELSTALQKSAATLSLMGNTIDEAASLVTTANATIQDADSVSAGLRTISLRLVGTEEAEEELSAMNEEVDAFVKSTNSKKQQIIKDYTTVASNNYQGFDILDSNGNYKNTYQILLGIAKVYKEIQEQDKKLGTNHATALIEELAGKNRSNIASAILQDPTQLEAVKKSSEEAMGSAQKELNSYLDSIDGKMAQLENRAQKFWVKVINSDAIKNGIDLLSTLLKNVTGFVDKVGLLPTIFTGVGAALSFKNVGINTLVAY